MKVGCGHAVQDYLVRKGTDQIPSGYEPCRYRVPFDALRARPTRWVSHHLHLTIVFFAGEHVLIICSCRLPSLAPLLSSLRRRRRSLRHQRRSAATRQLRSRPRWRRYSCMSLDDRFVCSCYRFRTTYCTLHVSMSRNEVDTTTQCSISIAKAHELPRRRRECQMSNEVTEYYACCRMVHA